MLTVLGMAFSLLLVPFLWLGFRFGVDRDRTNIGHRLSWTLYFAGLHALAFFLSFELLDRLEVHEHDRRVAFLFSWLLPYGGVGGFLLRRTVRRRRATVNRAIGHRC